MNQKIFSLVLIVTFICCNVSVVSAEASEKLSQVLGARHVTVSRAKLEQMAGGADACVDALLKLRTDETSPFVGVRAEKFLFNYIDREEVVKALEEDIQSENRAGLARLIAIHLDKVKNAAVRKRLAELAIERGQKNLDFKPYAKVLLESGDTEVKRLAKQAFDN